MRIFFSKAVPLWIAILILIAITAIAAVVFIKFGERIYDYQLTIPGGEQRLATYTYGSWPALANANFYNQVLASFIDQRATFISANLTTMRLTLYQDGAATQEVPILAKGRPGSWWETPAGLYKIVEKVPTDYSSFANVYMPWGLAFQGNFLIHGWPYYPDGTPVSSQYSGGCIRLSTNDAKSLYHMASVGMPVLVSSASFEADSFTERPAGPPLTSESFLAADLKSNFVFAEKNPDEQLPIASLTKLMTALVAVEYINIENKITITPDMIVPTSRPRLKAGEQISLYNLLQPLLKESSNEAAVAISDFLGSKYFVSLMNQKAAAIGMTHTTFVDPSGSGWGNVSSAHDLFMLAQYLYDNRSFILMMTTNKKDPNIYGPTIFTDLQNFNVFADDPDFVGGKVGINGAASDTILSIFNEPFAVPEGTSSMADRANTVSSTINLPMSENTTTRSIMFVILKSDNYVTDAQNFLSWIKNSYQ